MANRPRKGFIVAGACLAAVVIFAMVVPTLLRRREAASEISAPHDLQIIDAAIKVYTKDHGHAPPDLKSLRGQIPSALSCDAPPCEYRLYLFRYTVSSPEPARLRYSLSAQARLHGGHSFYLDETGILRYTSDDREATNSDPPLPNPPAQGK